MEDVTIDLMYGKGLFLAAETVEKTEKIQEDLRKLADLFHREEALYKVLCAPTVSRGEKKAVIQQLFEEKITRESLHFLYVLIDKGRMRHFDQISREYDRVYNEDRGVTSGRIYSVSPLSEDQRKAFEARTGELLKKEVSLINAIDRSLIGGVRIFIDGKLLDASVKNRLEKLAENLGMMGNA